MAPPDPGTFGSELRRLRERRDLSIRDLADLAYQSKTVVWEWEAGAKIPPADVASSLDTILDSGHALAELQAGATRPDPQRRLQHESEHLAEQLAALSTGDLVPELDRSTSRLAVDYLSSPGAALMDEITDARREAMAGLRARRLRNHHQIRYLIGDVGYLSGILAYAALDDGHPGAALAHTDAAWEAANCAGSDQLRAWVRGTQSLILRFAQRYPEALARAQDGLRYATSGTARARLLAGVGQCQANMGDAASARLALAQAQTAFEEQRGVDELGGVFTFSRAKLLYYSGSSLIWLDGGADAREARDQAHTAIELWQDAGPERSVADEALAHVYAATGSLQVRELEEAEADLEPILSLPAERRVSWVVKRMDRITGMLVEPPFDTDPLARELLERIKNYG
jgi:transcriptional regulator with XRE-family HTH domain